MHEKACSTTTHGSTAQFKWQKLRCWRCENGLGAQGGLERDFDHFVSTHKLCRNTLLMEKNMAKEVVRLLPRRNFQKMLVIMRIVIFLPGW